MAEGTSSWCKPVTNGCFAGGSCDDSDDGKEQDEEWIMACVDVQTPSASATDIASAGGVNGLSASGEPEWVLASVSVRTSSSR